MRQSVRLICQALSDKGFKPIQAIYTKRKGGDLLTWFSRVDGDRCHLVILQEYDGGTCGCKLFIQATTSNSVEKTIEAIP